MEGSVTPACNIYLSFPSVLAHCILLFTCTVVTELRVLKTGYLKTLLVILGQDCPLSAGLYGVLFKKKKPILFSPYATFWSWEKDDNFDNFINNVGDCAGAIQWIDVRGNPVSVSSEGTENDQLMQKTRLVENGEIIGHVEELLFRDPDNFVAGELHKHITQWAEIAKLAPSSHQEEVLSWIGNKVSIFPYFKHFKGTFKGGILRFRSATPQIV